MTEPKTTLTFSYRCCHCNLFGTGQYCTGCLEHFGQQKLLLEEEDAAEKYLNAKQPRS